MQAPTELRPLSHALLSEALHPLVEAGTADDSPDAVIVRHPALPQLTGRVAVLGSPGSLAVSIDLPLGAAPADRHDLERLANDLNVSSRWPAFTVRLRPDGETQLVGVACYPSPYSGVTVGHVQLLIATSFDGAYLAMARTVPDAAPHVEAAPLVGRLLAPGLARHAAGPHRATPQLIRAAFDDLGWRYGTFGTAAGDHIVALFSPANPGEAGLQVRATCFGAGPDGITVDASTDRVFDPLLRDELMTFCLEWNHEHGWPKAAVVAMPASPTWPEGLLTVRADLDLPLGGEARLDSVACVAGELVGRARTLWGKLESLSLGSSLALDDATFERLLGKP